LTLKLVNIKTKVVSHIFFKQRWWWYILFTIS